MPTLYYIQNRKIIKIITGAVDDIDRVILDDLRVFYSTTNNRIKEME